MMRRQWTKNGSWLVALVALGAAVAPARAQGGMLYYPARFQATEGRGNTSIPFGLATSVRLQTLYEPRLIDAFPRKIVEFALRADWSSVQGRDTIAAKQYITLWLYVSHARTTHNSISSTFGDNRGADEVAVVANRRLALPAQPKLAAGPRPFNLALKLDKPFLYTQTKGPLLLEYLVMAQPKGSYPIDSSFLCDSRGVDFGSRGPACVVGASQKPMLLANNASIKAGGSVTWLVSQAPKQSVAIVTVGTQEAGGSAFGSTLPIDLTVYGAKGCYINTDWVLMKAAATTTNGTASFSYAIPNRAFLVDFWFRAQVFALDLTANPMGFVFSLGRRAQVCGPSAVARVFATGSLEKLSGVVQMGSAPVLALRWQ